MPAIVPKPPSPIAAPKVTTPAPAAPTTSVAPVAPKPGDRFVPATPGTAAPVKATALPTFSPTQLSGLLDQADAVAKAAHAAPWPADAKQLVAAYWNLGNALSQAQAALFASVEALDSGKVDRATYEALKTRAFATLRAVGAEFQSLEPVLAKHGGDPLIPDASVRVKEDRGDGRPLFVYGNTFKQAKVLNDEQKRGHFQSRLDRFVGGGGKFEDIIVGKPGVLDALPSGVRHDYLVTEDGTLRMYPNERDDNSSPRPGHSLLATGDANYREVRALMAGDLLTLKGSDGELEAVLVSNNSGHFRPAAEDLPNLLPVLEQLGVPKEKVVFVAGPNNLWPVFKDIAKKRKVPSDVEAAMPPSPLQVLEVMAKGLPPARPPELLWA